MLSMATRGSSGSSASGKITDTYPSGKRLDTLFHFPVLLFHT
jgi:hypothetical protein